MDINNLRQAALSDIKSVSNAKQLEKIRIKYLGREHGELTVVLRSLKDMPVEERRKVGPEANKLRGEIESALQKKLEQFKVQSLKLHAPDLTMPGKKISIGHLHPLTLMENKVREIFQSLNFSVVEGPEVETEYYNFDALNIPPNHPARDLWDTFWLRGNQKQLTSDSKQLTKSQRLNVTGQRLLLRTHTSPMQIRYMEKHNPPFQIIVPGRVFRFEATDASHETNFHQVEGLMVGEDVSLANFKYVIEEFFKRLFGRETEIRFRPSYFPFVEPGLEVDIKISRNGHGSLVKSRGSEWLEVMGAGMVHPSVFEHVRYNPRDVQGFAFGLGLERLAMIQYKIDDIRLFYSGDLRFIKQF